MGITSKYFNKIINLYFLNEDGSRTEDKIVCPVTGRKPSIEFVGTFEAKDNGLLPSFTITVTNLYISLIKIQYPSIKVEAGYYGNLVSFTGQIMSVFQESPGPDGKTVISCLLGTVNKRLNSVIDVNFSTGDTLEDVIKKISNGVGFTSDPQIPEDLKSLPLPAEFAENGQAMQVAEKLFKLFPEKKLRITEEEKKLYVYSLGDSLNETKKVTVEYLISPPQKNPGDEDGAYYTVFTAPWNPSVMPGVKVIFPSWEYIKFFNLVNENAQTNSAVAIRVMVHFATNGSINQMQVTGIGAKE